ncbi:hypothetical protein KHQ89_04575 [Mycoplasmatota bacterium]|nr:hypothetical protein KHQ89_04575 [Mycoplasmatota bacterium]
MGKNKFGYGWLLKFILAAILLGVGIYMYFADQVVYAITGIAIIVFSLLRVVPLVKSLNKEVLRTLNIIEIIFDVLIGTLITYIAFAKGDVLDSEPIWAAVYRYALVVFFYGRALVYFNSVVFFGEKTEVPKFWAHIVIISVGAMIAVSADFNYEVVGLIFLIISLIGAIYLGYDGYGGYKIYREKSLALNEGKEASVENEKPKDKQKKKPVIEEPEEEKRPYVN